MPSNESHQTEKQAAFSLYENGQLDQARLALQSYCKTVPDDPEAWVLLSVINGSLALYEDATYCGQRAIELAPGNIQAYFNTAVAQYSLEKPDEAIALFNEVLQRQPDHGFALYLMGRCYELKIDQDDNAIACYKRALGLNPQPPHLAVHLIKLYERVGDKDKAMELLDQLLLSRPNDPGLGAIKARIDADNGLLSDARKRLEDLINSGKLTPDTRASTLNKLGLVLDKLGEYDKAYEAFTECHQIDAEDMPEGRGEHYYHTVNHCKGVTTPENVSAWEKNTPGNDHTSPIFLVGFHRSGTTLAERIIASHPEMRTSSEGELLEGVIARLNVITGSSLEYPYNLNELSKEQVTLLRKEYWRVAKQKCGAMPDKMEFLDKSPLNIVHI